MRRLLDLFATLSCGIVLVGCSSGAADVEPTPKGTPPNTMDAPPGAKNPEERGMEEQKANEKDGGGQDGT